MFKFDKSVWMNFFHSFIGGILGGLVIAASLGQAPKVGALGYYVIFLAFVLIVGLAGVFLMAHLNYRWEQTKGRIRHR